VIFVYFLKIVKKSEHLMTNLTDKSEKIIVK